MKRKENGITLIALIVTIIVMLILASITVATLTGRNSVITRAENAKNVTEQSQLDENKTIGDYEDYINQWTNNLTQPDNPVTPPADEPEGGTGYNLADKAEIGQYVNYDPAKGVNDESKLSYTSPVGSGSSHGNGDESQTFSVDAYKNSGGKWQIFDIDDDGTITLISDLISRDNEDGTNMINFENRESGLKLSSGIGYLWAEEELNRICAIYGHGLGANTSQTITYYYGGPYDQDGSITADTVGSQQGRKTTLKVDGKNDILYTGARALNLYDFNGILGLNRTIDYSIREDTVTGIKAQYYPAISEEADLNGVMYNDSASSATYHDTYIREEGELDIKIEILSSDSEKIKKQKDMITKNKGVCWLASRGIRTTANYSTPAGESDLNTLGFDVWDIDLDAYDEHFLYLCDLIRVSDFDEDYGRSGAGNAVRAVVTLKKDVLTTDETYNEETGWNIAENN